MQHKYTCWGVGCTRCESACSSVVLAEAAQWTYWCVLVHIQRKVSQERRNLKKEPCRWEEEGSKGLVGAQSRPTNWAITQSNGKKNLQCGACT